MDAYEATRVVYSRIQAMDPENAAKIISLLLVQDHGDKEMIRLAFGPDALIHSLVAAARTDLNAHSKPPSPLSISPPSWSFPRGASFNGRDDLTADDNQLPCLYYARGFCKNGSSCRFLHSPPNEDPGAFEQDLLLRSRSTRLGAGAFPFSPTSPSARTMSFLLQQQQNSTQRAAAAAAAMMLGGDEGYKYMGRPRMENPGSRQIYLTFPADSTFREEDVSNYFSIYGPVQDVRIPYQQKRMFGFVTFLYPETVKLILAKGNPHFVCDARVLVKPYKEKGKVPDKYRKQQGEALDFSACITPTGLERDPYELQHFGGRVMYNGNGGQELLLRRKLEEQKQTAELQQAIELQGRRFMGLQLMDVKTRTLPSPIGTRNSPNSVFSTPDQTSSPEDKSPSSDASAASATANSFSQAADQLLSTSSGSSNGLLHRAAVKVAAGAIDEFAGYDSGELQESAEHNLPDNLFDMPAKPSITGSGGGGNGGPFSDSSEEDFITAFGQPAASPFDIAPFKSGFLQMHRFSSGHGAVGM